MSKQEEPTPASSSTRSFNAGPDMGQVVEAFTGFNMKFLRTMRDLVLHPFLVADESLAGRRDAHMGQVRLFIFLLGAQTLLFGLTGFYDNASVERMLGNRPDVIASYAEHVQQSGHTLDEVNADIKDWFSFMISPVSALAIFFYALFFKLLDRRYTLFGHGILYVVVNNISTLLTLPLALIVLMGSLGFNLYSGVMAALNLIYLCVFVWHYFRKSILNGVLKVIAMVVFFVMITMLISVTMWGGMNVVAEVKYGKGFFNHIYETVRDTKSKQSETSTQTQKSTEQKQKKEPSK